MLDDLHESPNKWSYETPFKKHSLSVVELRFELFGSGVIRIWKKNIKLKSNFALNFVFIWENNKSLIKLYCDS